MMRTHRNQLTRWGEIMKEYIKAFAVFLAMAAVTKLLVVPVAQKANVPVLKDL